MLPGIEVRDKARERGVVRGPQYFENPFTVEARKLKHDCPSTPEPREEG